AANRGLADWDRRHVFTQSIVYELPFGQGKRWAQSGPASWALGGWQFNSLWTWESGLPLDMSISSASLNAPGNINRPNVNCTPEYLGSRGPRAIVFDCSTFLGAEATTFGNFCRYVLAGPRLFDIDFSVFRRFRLTERMNLEFRGESFNLSNTPHFDRPNTN